MVVGVSGSIDEAAGKNRCAGRRSFSCSSLKMMKLPRLLHLVRALILIVPLLGSTLWAQPFAESHVAAAEKLVALEGGEESYNDGLTRMLDQQTATNPQFARVRDVLESWQRQYLSWEVLEPEYVKVVCATYTEEEIRDIIAFYETEAGEKLLQKGTDVSFELMKISQRLSQEHQLELQMMMRDRMKQIQAEARNLIPDWTPPPEEAPVAEREFEVFKSSHFDDGGMKELVYPVTGAVLLQEPEADPFGDTGMPVDMRTALRTAFDGFYAELDVTWDQFKEEADLRVSRYTFAPEEDAPETARDIWFYVVNVGIVRGARMLSPPDVVVLASGQLVRPQEKR